MRDDGTFFWGYGFGAKKWGDRMNKFLLANAATVAALVVHGAQAADGATYTPASSVVPGHYACLEFKGNRAIEFGQYTGVKFSNQFDISADGTYVYRGSKPAPGTYSLDRASGQITWLSGPYAPSNDGSSMEGLSANRTSDGKPLIILTFHIPRFPATKEWCAPVK